MTSLLETPILQFEAFLNEIHSKLCSLKCGKTAIFILKSLFMTLDLFQAVFRKWQLKFSIQTAYSKFPICLLQKEHNIVFASQLKVIYFYWCHKLCYKYTLCTKALYFSFFHVDQSRSDGKKKKTANSSDLQSSPTGPAEHCAGGSLWMSFNSFTQKSYKLTTIQVWIKTVYFQTH